MRERSEAHLHRDVARAIAAMAPYLDQVVLCGGWVPRLYRTMPAFEPSPVEPELSWDLDWVLPNRLAPEPAGGLGAVLRAHDLVAVFSRDREPPVVRYQGKEYGSEDLAPVHVDLLTPLTGSVVSRSGEDKTLQEVQKGVRAQALRYLDLLLFEPLLCDASALPAIALPHPTYVRVPNPMSFLLQKALSAPLREEAGKRDKDLVYIYDVASITRPAWEPMRATLTRIEAAHGVWASWVPQARKEFESAFGNVDSPGPIAVERQLAGLSPAPSARAAHRAMAMFRTATGLVDS